jgi:hypothetical protein
MNGAIARIVLRYIVGAFLGMEIGQELAGDPDIVMLAALGVGFALNEGWYFLAKRFGWST